MKLSTICLVIVVAMASCVPARLLDESKDREKKCGDELAAIKKSSQENDAALAELKEKYAKASKTLDGLVRDTTLSGINFRNISSRYEKLNTLNEQLMDRLNKLVSGAEKDNAKLSGDLQMTTEQLLRKQDELKALETRLNQQKADLDVLNEELKKREVRVKELEDILRKKMKPLLPSEKN